MTWWHGDIYITHARQDVPGCTWVHIPGVWVVVFRYIKECTVRYIDFRYINECVFCLVMVHALLSQSYVAANTKLLLYKLNNNGDMFDNPLPAINKSHKLTEDINIDDYVKSCVVMVWWETLFLILICTNQVWLNFLNCCPYINIMINVVMINVHVLGLPILIFHVTLLY